MDVKQFEALWKEYKKTLQDNDASAWSQKARDWAVREHIVNGSNGNYMWEAPLSREEMTQMLYNFAQYLGK